MAEDNTPKELSRAEKQEQILAKVKETLESCPDERAFQNMCMALGWTCNRQDVTWGQNRYKGLGAFPDEALG